MSRNEPRALQQFKTEVGVKFQLYNGLFTALPFHRIENTGILLSLLLNDCEEGYNKGLSPTEIIEDFFARQATSKTPAGRVDMLFRFTQYAERQVVLFDALEDAAFKQVNDVNGAGSIKQLLAEVQEHGKQDEFQKKLEDFCIQLVLTAHPTQFYTGEVLGIIHDATKAVVNNNVTNINTYLQQLGKTPFLKRKKPTPYDEATSLLWFLENVFYSAAGEILAEITSQYPMVLRQKNPVIKMGFWPGGDRDGNPFVNASTTLRVADALRGAIIRCYYLDLRKLRRRLTFKGVEPLVKDLERKLYNNIFVPENKTSISREIILDILEKIKTILEEEHNGLFLHLVDALISKVYVFGLHFATLDIRQEATVHEDLMASIAKNGDGLPENYVTRNDDEKIKILTSISNVSDPKKYDDILKDTLLSVSAMKRIQKNNGEYGCNRYIISQCRSALHVMEVYGIFALVGWDMNALPIDIIPLFETVTDLENAGEVMTTLYENPEYAAHIKQRGSRQVIMLGFSDGTKDGGYLMANWGIYKAKEALTSVSKKYGVEVVFFDGRGGPPARGGGKTHKFYASMGENISNKEIQLTVQGQTISSSFGTVDSARFNMEQLLTAGLGNGLFQRQQSTLQDGEVQLIDMLAQVSLEKYISLKSAPHFMDYLLAVSPMKYYGEANIGSRPSKRGSGKLTLKDLRAIPYVGAWSQIKQNVPGFYGVGTALKMLDEKGNFAELSLLYKRSLFVRTLFDNCEMAMLKCFFPLTAHLQHDEKYKSIWNEIHEEYELTKKYILKLNGSDRLMQNYPIEELSIGMRDRIVLPLSTIQQYAISKMNDSAESGVDNEVYKKLVVRCSFGIINAARNSV